MDKCLRDLAASYRLGAVADHAAFVEGCLAAGKSYPHVSKTRFETAMRVHIDYGDYLLAGHCLGRIYVILRRGDG